MCFPTAGVGVGDVVALYMPISPVAVASMLATARIGKLQFLRVNVACLNFILIFFINLPFFGIFLFLTTLFYSMFCFE